MKVLKKILNSAGQSINAGQRRFIDSANYWEQRYISGRDSGAGSYGALAIFKAATINHLVATQDISSVIEFGTGDGNQLGLINPPKYLGFDISPTAVKRCTEIFREDPTKSFNLVSAYAGETAELTLSLDVIYHLIEDTVFDAYMRQLFSASKRLVCIYSSNGTPKGYTPVPHVKHRKFTRWIEQNEPNWSLRDYIPNRHPYSVQNSQGSFADFYIYQRSF